MRKSQKNKGITLIALIITIIVLLILAGVSISLVVGDNGVLKQSRQAVTKTDLVFFLEEANQAYEEVYASYIEKEDYSHIITLGEVASKLNEKKEGSVLEVAQVGATYEIIGFKVNNVVFDESNDVIKLSSNGGQAKTLQVLTKIDSSEGNAKYYAIIKGIYYEMNLSSENSKIELGDVKKITEINNSSSSVSPILRIALKSGSIGNVNVATINQESKTAEIVGTSTTGNGVLVITYGNAEAKEISVEVATDYSVKLYRSSTSTCSTEILVEESGNVFQSSNFDVAQLAANSEAPNGKKFDKWVLKSMVEGYEIGSDATSLMENVSCNFEVYAIFRDIPIVFSTFGSPLNPTSYGDVYKLTTGEEKIMVDINNTPNDSSDDVEVPDTWKIFYEDIDYLYLIYNDYYPVSAQTNSDAKFIHLSDTEDSSSGVWPYAMWSLGRDQWNSPNRDNLLSYLSNNMAVKERNDDTYGSQADRPGYGYLSWSKLKEAIKALDKMNDKMIFINGAPNKQLWDKSWTAKGNNTILDSTNVNGVYFYGNSNGVNVKNDSTWNINASEENKTGYYDELFFPYRGSTSEFGDSANKATGYWIASVGPYLTNNPSVCAAGYSGYVGGGYSAYGKTTAARPVIAIEKRP